MGHRECGAQLGPVTRHIDPQSLSLSSGRGSSFTAENTDFSVFLLRLSLKNRPISCVGSGMCSRYVFKLFLTRNWQSWWFSWDKIFKTFFFEIKYLRQITRLCFLELSFHMTIFQMCSFAHCFTYFTSVDVIKFSKSVSKWISFMAVLILFHHIILLYFIIYFFSQCAPPSSRPSTLSLFPIIKSLLWFAPLSLFFPFPM